MAESIIVLASGTKTGGGSGFEKLVSYFRNAQTAKIAGVVSNISGGGVQERAARLEVSFMHLPNAACTPEGYGSIAAHFGLERPWYACSGWLRHVAGLPVERTFNIHPALLSKLGGRFGGPGMYGHHVHEAVRAALLAGELAEDMVSGFTMHFVTEAYDRGPTLAEVSCPIDASMSADDIAKRVNALEHRWQAMLTEMVVRGQLRLENGAVVAPFGYGLLPK